MRSLVTGASGFLGGALARALLARGEAVRVFARREMPELAALGAEVCRGDLAAAAAVGRAVAGCSRVFHVGAKAGVWGARAGYHAANVLGTQHVLDACRAHGVQRLVYTSTPSVVHAGESLVGVDESAPYATHFDSPYAETKAEAERRVLAANGAALATVALRPHLIWGPGDTQLLPRLVDRARRGRLLFPGGGRARVDSTFIDSAVEAHLLAADRLAPGAPCAGRAYFVSQGEPLPVMELVNRLLATAGVGPVTRTVPVGLAVAAGAVLEAAWGLTRAAGEPPFTRFVARQLATEHFFALGAVRRDLGYGPRLTLADGLERLRIHFAAQAA